MNEILLMVHVLFGAGCILAAVWVFVEALNASEANQARTRLMSRCVATAMWLAFVAGGFWYVTRYATDKEIILKGPWPFAHNSFMETKEHLVILLLLLASYLPIAAAHNLATNRDARKLVLCVAALVVLLGLTIEGEGAVIAMGVKVGLLAR